ncbi:ABC transporter substrate-binding protein [Paenibacillus ginsengarvi]|uniref:Extracellular solute-binding protein n=1 Tax=Paenibacillus ginsengarvi TaxID=400777 RepID=A0A3B0CJF2_9BACL|nr:extracellular solute-binding protein [Paenibacillus ginsengarvi]RKN85140.1 extracellular solute-binding protein [Paenibacillus ginsengarvi]
MPTKFAFRQTFPIAAILAAMLLAAGCVSKPPDLPPQQSPEPARKTLKIAYFNEQSFTKEYGNTFKKFNPNVDIEIIPMVQTSGGKTVFLENAAILEKKPDIVYGPTLITDTNKAGKLVDLSGLVKQDNFDLGQFAENALEAIRDTTDGRLVALSPSFQTAALFYNKKIFDRLGLPYPAGGMSWQSMMSLAKSISRDEGGKRLYGLQNYSTPTSFASSYIAGMGVSMYSSNQPEAKFTSDAFQTAFGEAVNAFRSGAFYLPPEEPVKTKEDSLSRSKFIIGEAAMMISTPSLFAALREAPGVSGVPAVDYDIVVEPVSPSGSSFLVADLFGIMKDSPNMQVAWEFLKFVTGQEMAAELIKTKPGVLSIRKDAITAIDGHKLDPFYAKKPKPISISTLSPELARKLNDMVTEEFTHMLYERKSVTDGLKQLQQRAQIAIHEDSPAAKSK